MYSRSSDDHSGVGTEDHVNFTLNANGGYEILLVGRNINTANTENMSLSTSNSQVVTTAWQHVSTTWKWTSPSTTIKLQKNGSEINTVVVADVFLEDGSNYDSFWGVQENLVSSTVTLEDPYEGFIYEIVLANFENTSFTAYIETNCPGFGGCDFCHTAQVPECLPTCEIDEVVEDDGTCDLSCPGCTCGCIREQNCNLCKDWHCSSCEEYTTDSCLECDANIAEPFQGNCSCLFNFQEQQYSRDPSDTHLPCCAANCDTCSNAQHFKYCSACASGFYIQPRETTDFVVCFSDCPTGYTENSSGSCDLVRQCIVEYDLTYIQDDIVNLVNVSSNHANADMSLFPGFTSTYAYKLRGRYSNGTTDAISIGGLNLHHTFTLTTWLYLDTLNDDATVFAKEKGGNYSQTSRENLLELQISAEGALMAKLYYNSSELFDAEAKSDDLSVAIETWYAVAYVFDFDGENTSVSLYKNASLLSTYVGLGFFLEDTDDYEQAWLFVATDSVNSTMTPVRGLNGFLYRLAICQNTDESNVTDDYTNVACLGLCNYCPTNVGPTDANQCLCTADRNSYCDDSNVAQSCQTTCSTNNGCVRSLDCNRCHDRQCQSCVNFDEGATCSQCIDNASNVSECECDTSWVFSEATDTCEDCHNHCHVCNTDTYKDCTECATDHYMQDGLSVCLPYCATSYTEDDTSNSCTYTTTSMFDLTVSLWSQDFRDYYDSINSIAVQMGANPDYENDDPTITNPQDDLKEFYFDGTDDCMLIKEESVGRGGLLLHHTMTVSIWIFSDGTPTSEEALLSKVDKSRTNNSNKITFGIGPGDTQWMTMTEFDNSGNLQNYSINLMASPSPQFGTSWTLLTYQIQATDSQVSTLRLYVNGGDQTGLTIEDSSVTWFDNLEAAGFIGCTHEYSTTTWNNTKFFKGYMYRLAIWNDIKT